MGQGDILKILEKNKNPLSTREIAGKLKRSTSTICCSLQRLYKQGEIAIIRKKYNKQPVECYFIPK